MALPSEATNQAEYTFDLNVEPAFGGASKEFTKMAGGPIVRYESAGDADDPASDMALFRLDTVVPKHIANPLHPPEQMNACGAEFDGVLVGYGTHLELPATVCVQQPRIRRFINPREFERDSGGWFESTFGPDTQAGVCDWYRGAVKGDSGGLLIRDDNDTLCGVISQYYPTYLGGGFLEIDTDATRADSFYAVAWFDINLKDSDGVWDGECALTTGNDLDGDGYPNACDTCPTVWNPEQAYAHYDDDNDGIPNACDFCPGVDDADTVVDGVQPNANMAYEISRFWDMITDVGIKGDPAYTWGPEHIDRVPVIVRPDGNFQTATDLRDDALHWLRLAYKPDACDAAPIPGSNLSKGGGIPLDATPGPLCPHAEAVVHNKIVTSVNSAAIAPSGGGTVGFRFCNCPSGISERQCQTSTDYGCKYLYNEYDLPTSSWVPITTIEANGSNPTYGTEFPVAFDQGSASYYWDFTELPPEYINGDPETESNAEGRLWTSVQTASGISSQDLQRSNGYSFVRPEARVECQELLQNEKFFDELAFCPGCPYFAMLSGIEEVSNPSAPIEYHRTLLGPGGSSRALAVDSSQESFYGSLLAGSLKYVPASEHPSLLASRSSGAITTGFAYGWSDSYVMVSDSPRLPSQPELYTGAGGGMAMMQSSSSIGGLLTPPSGPFSTPGLLINEDGSKQAAQPALLAEANAQSFGGAASAAASPAAHDAYAFSATEMAFFRLGERLWRNDTWHAVGHRLDLETGLYDIIDFGPNGPFNVEAAAFRMQDRSVYFIETDGGIRYLTRWRAMFNHDSARSLVRLAELGSGWDAYARMWITVSPLGDIVLLGATLEGASNPKATIVRLTMNRAELLGDAAFRSETTEILAGPRAAEGGLVFGAVTPDPKAVYRGYGSFGAAARGYAIVRLSDSAVLDGS